MTQVLRLTTVFVLAVCYCQSAYAESPRTQLKQMDEQLQQNPNDDALREKIIALSLKLNPKPATPDAAIMAEGAAEYAFKNAKSNSDYSDAARQYEKALLIAPWLANDYFNCGVAHEKAGENQQAIHSFNFYLMAAPHASDAKDIKNRIGGLQYAEQKMISDSAAKTVADATNAKAAFIQSIQGYWSNGNPSFPKIIFINPTASGEVSVSVTWNGQSMAVSDIETTESTLQFTVDDVEDGNPESLLRYSLSLYPNDHLEGTRTDSLTESGKAMIRQHGGTFGGNQTLSTSYIRQ